MATPDVAISGASGLLGGALARRVGERGGRVRRLVRRRGDVADGDVFFSPDRGEIDGDALAGATAVVHLAGASVADGRWTPERKRVIRDSRVVGTRLVSEAIAALPPPRPVLVSASAVGYYGATGDREVDEDSPAGEGFLADVCRAWEQAADPAREAGVRVVHLRIGIVLSPDGGPLEKMLGPFRWGVGGRLGSGAQYMSWVHVDDVLGAIERCWSDPALVGPVNAVAPEPVTNAELTRALGAVLRRPTALPVPGFALRLGFGSEMAEEMLLSGQRVVPRRLREAGFEWAFGDLDAALRACVAG